MLPSLYDLSIYILSMGLSLELHAVCININSISGASMYNLSTDLSHKFYATWPV